MRVLIADKLDLGAVESLERAGHRVSLDPGLSGDPLRDAIAHYRPHALVVRSTRVLRDHLNAASCLALVVRAGAGVNTIDLSAAGGNAVFVANCPGKNAAAVAELSMGLMLAVDRHIASNVIDARSGRWNKGAWSKAKGLKGRSLGLLGFGRIGAEVATRARAFDMKVFAWSRSLTPERAEACGVIYCASPQRLAEHSDVLSVHLAITEETRGMVDAELLARLPDGATLINTSRAGVVDEDALWAALNERGLWAGLDVFEGEPAGKSGALESRLADHPQVVLTHHIGASTAQAQVAVAQEAVRVLLAYDRTGTVPNCVNLETQTQASYLLVVRHADRVGVLAAILSALRAADLNVQEMENTIFAGGAAALARIQIAGDPSTLLPTLREHEHVIDARALPLAP